MWAGRRDGHALQHRDASHRLFETRDCLAAFAFLRASHHSLYSCNSNYSLEIPVHQNLTVAYLRKKFSLCDIVAVASLRAPQEHATEAYLEPDESSPASSCRFYKVRSNITNIKTTPQFAHTLYLSQNERRFHSQALTGFPCEVRTASSYSDERLGFRRVKTETGDISPSV